MVTHQDEPAGGRTVSLEVTGQDHPGIVRDLSHALAALGISIEEMRSETRSASMSGGALFNASLRLSVPSSVSVDDLRESLEALANEIMVDIELEG